MEWKGKLIACPFASCLNHGLLHVIFILNSLLSLSPSRSSTLALSLSMFSSDSARKLGESSLLLMDQVLAPFPFKCCKSGLRASTQNAYFHLIFRTIDLVHPGSVSLPYHVLLSPK